MTRSLPVRRLLPLALLLAAGTLASGARSTAVADDGPAADTAPPALVDPFPFDHAGHAKAFERGRVTCIDCHPVGLRVSTPQGPVAPDTSLHAPRTSCHACHLDQLAHAPGAATPTCASCHADMHQLTPASHDATWLTDHGPDSRAFARDCASCHDQATCFDCHDDRGPSATNPHPPAFRSTHGMEARLDPRSCSTCHTGETCSTCHATGAESGGGWPW